MKYLLIAFSLITSISIQAQSENENFYLAENALSWKKVYETTKSKQDVINYFKESGLFWSTETVADTLFCKLKAQHVDETKTGVAGVPAIVNKTAFKGLVRIELKDKKYRVIFSNIILVGDGEILKKGEEQTFEYNFLTKENTEYRPGFLKKPNSIYNITFSDLFEIASKKKDDW
ncbi:MAG: hypothetical protein KDD24_09315 [Flavobacteriales bacterium]|nr:hypothetical protein [Flavobacteriales bacterium]MCB9173391.1 hypothetical protein [Flavobacteriales bacterium]